MMSERVAPKAFTARRHHLRSDNTVSCGCVGRAKFKERHQNFAAKLSEETVVSRKGIIFNLESQIECMRDEKLAIAAEMVRSQNVGKEEPRQSGPF
jgi:hypothetical protein